MAALSPRPPAETPIMAIDANCPFCQKAYKLKDDLLGKKVTCADPACRKVFEVVPSKNGKPPTPSAAPLDADAVAAAALADDGESVPVDQRTVAMTCTICEHKWTVPWASQGKNVLCPDCKHRQKVPEQKATKKVDWRDGSGRPSLAKQEELPGVVASTDNRMVSGETLIKTNVIGVQYEPRPTSFYVKVGLLAVVVLGVVGFGGMSLVRSRGTKQQEKLIEEALKAVDAEELKQLPPNVSPAFRGALLLAAGEHEARSGDQKRVETAVGHFNRARTELERSARSGDRDACLATMPTLILTLGGDDAEVIDHKKLPWVPGQGSVASKVRMRPSVAESKGVQDQLRLAFEALKSAGVEFEFRAAAARQAARKLANYNQTPMLVSTLQSGFHDPEQAEVIAQIGLELLRAGQKDAAREVAESLKGTAPGGGMVPTSAVALWLAVEPPTAGVPALVPSPPASGPVNEDTRMAYTALYMAQNKPTDARELATRPGKPDGRLRALALAAEWAETPGPFVEEAVKIIAEEVKKPQPTLPALPILVRLATDAGRANMAEAANKIAEGIFDDGLREWAKAEALRARLALDRGIEATETDAPLPDDAKKYRLGHAAARTAVARHNAARTGDRDPATKYAKEWPAGLIAPFGQAGVALGVQDAERK